MDIICKDKKEFETWTTGIQALLNGFSDKEAVESYMAALSQNNKRRQTKSLQEDKVKVSFSSALTINRTKVLVQESEFCTLVTHSYFIYMCQSCVCLEAIVYYCIVIVTPLQN